MTLNTFLEPGAGLIEEGRWLVLLFVLDRRVRCASTCPESREFLLDLLDWKRDGRRSLQRVEWRSTFAFQIAVAEGSH